MKRIIYRVLPAVAVLAVVLPVATADAKSNKAKAVQAVKEEIGRKYVALDASTPTLAKISGAKASVFCDALNSTRFKCDWHATNDLGEEAFGSARVQVFSKGADATLYADSCSSDILDYCIGDRS